MQQWFSGCKQETLSHNFFRARRSSWRAISSISSFPNRQFDFLTCEDFRVRKFRHCEDESGVFLFYRCQLRSKSENHARLYFRIYHHACIRWTLYTSNSTSSSSEFWSAGNMLMTINAPLHWIKITDKYQLRLDSFFCIYINNKIPDNKSTLIIMQIVHQFPFWNKFAFRLRFLCVRPGGKIWNLCYA